LQVLRSRSETEDRLGGQLVGKIQIALLSLLLAPVWLGAVEPYLGAGVGEKITTSQFGRLFRDLGVQARDQSWKLYGGLDLSRYLGVEVTYYDFGSRTCCPGLADAGFDTRLDGYSAALIGRLPLDRVELFGKVGLLLWEESGQEITIAGPRPLSADGAAAVLGVGIDVRIVENLGLRAEWETFDLEGDAASSLWLAAEIRF